MVEEAMVVGIQPDMVAMVMVKISMVEVMVSAF